MKLKFGDKTIDVATCLPLTIGDIKKLKAMGIDMIRFGENETDRSIDTVSKIVLYVLRKADPALTEEDVETLTLPDLIGFQKYMNSSQEKADVPT